MKKYLIVGFVGLLFGLPCFAYQDGVYKCPGFDSKLPADIYEIKTINVGGVALPYVNVTRAIQMESKTSVNKFQGIAHVMMMDGEESLLLGNMELQFKNGKMNGCTL